MTLGEVFTVGVLLVTAVIILFYTMYTKKLLQEIKTQTELQMRPVIVFDTEGDEFFIKNIGISTALNISVEEFLFVTKDDLIPISGRDGTNKYKYVFDAVNILEPKEKKFLTYKSYLNDQETEAKILLRVTLDPKYQLGQEIEFNIDYQNTLKGVYRTTIITGKSGIRVKEINKIS